LHFSTEAELTFGGMGWGNQTFSLPFLSLWVALFIALHFQISPCHFANPNYVTINTPLLLKRREFLTGAPTNFHSCEI